jgi:hypothetical protein
LIILIPFASASIPAVHVHRGSATRRPFEAPWRIDGEQPRAVACRRATSRSARTSAGASVGGGAGQRQLAVTSAMSLLVQTARVERRLHRDEPAQCSAYSGVSLDSLPGQDAGRPAARRAGRALPVLELRAARQRSRSSGVRAAMKWTPSLGVRTAVRGPCLDRLGGRRRLPAWRGAFGSWSGVHAAGIRARSARS